MASAETLAMFMPQLLEALKYEKSHYSELLAMLLQFASKSIRFAHKLYWQLKEFSSHVNDCMRLRYEMALQALKHLFSRAMLNEINRETFIMGQIDNIGLEVKRFKDNPVLCSDKLQRGLESLVAEWTSGKNGESSCRLPFNVSYCVRELDIKVK